MSEPVISSCYIPKEDEYIINVTNDLPDITLTGTGKESIKYPVYLKKEHMGIYIKTNLQDIYFTIEDRHFCCEEYDVSMKNTDDEILVDYQELKNKKIKSIKFKSPGLIKPNDYWKYKSDNMYDLELENETFTITISNDHNGYYEHTYVVKYGDYLDISEM